jgi:hypothetical protein
LLGLPLALMAHSLAFLPRGYINLEYLLIGALSVFLPRSAVFVLLFLESLADFAAAISQTYMLSAEDMLESLSSLRSLPASRILEMLVVVALLILICVAVARVRPQFEDRIWVAGGFLFLIAILASTATFTGQTSFRRADAAYSYERLARTPVFSLVRSEVLWHKGDYFGAHSKDWGRMNSASTYAMAYLNRPDALESPDVVLIVVESWGLPLDDHLAEALNAPYDDPRIARRYDVSYGAVPFRGSTVPGETRELCHSGMGFEILRAPPELLQECLPALFHARNYENLSIHGYPSLMFQRRTWYPKIGFDRSWFGPDLDKLKLPDCDGAFPGTCDAAIAGWIGSSILSVRTARPRFIYWVTLNSHLPAPAHPSLADDNVCSTLPSLRDSLPLCSWLRLVRNVHQSVQQLALGPSARPTVFVVVGDHAPPFANPGIRQLFSPTDVPYVVLTPRIAAS